MAQHLEPWEPQVLDMVVLFKRSNFGGTKVRTYPSTKVFTSTGGSDRLVLGSNPGNVTNMNILKSLNTLCGTQRTEQKDISNNLQAPFCRGFTQSFWQNCVDCWPGKPKLPEYDSFKLPNNQQMSHGPNGGHTQSPHYGTHLGIDKFLPSKHWGPWMQTSFGFWFQSQTKSLVRHTSAVDWPFRAPAAPMKSAKTACFEGTIFPSGNWAFVRERWVEIRMTNRSVRQAQMQPIVGPEPMTFGV